MKSIFAKTRILVCIGTGGVGKTTVAAALGALAAEEGRRVLVLTIDPAQRLKTTLNLSEDGAICELNHPRFKGKFSAAVINSKKTFDDFVLRAGKHSESAKKILQNKLYVQLSTTLSGSQEFTALQKLYEVHESGDFDLIILDTPPSKHAMDFLKMPQKLSALFQEGITKWFRSSKGGAAGFLGNLLHVGTKQVIKALELLTGSDFMRELSEFFSGIQGWQSKLEERTVAVHELLVHPDTHFLLVGSYDRAKLAEARRFGQEIRKSGYNLKNLILNRAFPEWLPELEAKPASTPAGKMATRLKSYYEARREQTQSLGELKKQQIRIFELPEMSEDIRDLNGVFELVDRMKEAR